MNWFKKIFGFLFKNKEKKEPLLLEDKSNSVNISIDFTDAIFSNIAEMKLRLENIKSEQEIYEELKTLIDTFEKYIEKSSKVMEERQIEDKLNSIKQSNIILELNTEPQMSIETKQGIVEHELTIEDYYKNVKAIYEVKYKRATQNILMREVEKLNGDLDKMLSLDESYEEEIKTKDIQSLRECYLILRARKDEFTGIMQNKYIERLIELDYKIRIIELISNQNIQGWTEYSKKEEFIKESKISRAKQIIWIRLFMENVENLVKRSNNDSTNILKEKLNKINLKENKEEILTEDLIELYVKAMAFTIKEKEELKLKQQKAKEEERQKEERQKELEKYKDLTPREIETKIEELDDKKFDIVTSYKNIMQYQMDVAMSKGLVDERNLLQIDDIEIIRIPRTKIPVVFYNLKENIYNCEIYTNIDDTKENVYLVIPKEINKNVTRRPSIQNVGGWYTKDVKVTNEFASLYSQFTQIKNIDFEEGRIYFTIENEKNLQKDIKKFKDQFEKENEQNAQKIKFYIEVPYRRTIIPILEELNQSKIEFTIPPTDKDTKMNRPMVRIYMDRKDLQKYKEEVHNKISTVDKGIVTIGEENVDIGQILIDGCDLEFLKDKDKQKSEH